MADRNLISFPPARNVRLIKYLVAKFLEIPGGPGRLRCFRRTILRDLAQRRRALGFPTATVNAELKEIERAMARRLAVTFLSKTEASG
ncbi:hypothetical protein [Microvirga aerophila]|uniref:Uncharacterized protein n=1 Tax=Microvirga aerophila TaxID=670291 RepID=A0A512C4E1_9HYPH|nr:hypothetical protein [Microvirga aerophila]GEO19081.1 hypothetical protein MAE02_67770 [Microvirga aerophila]